MDGGRDTISNQYCHARIQYMVSKIFPFCSHFPLLRLSSSNSQSKSHYLQRLCPVNIIPAAVFKQSSVKAKAMDHRMHICIALLFLFAQMNLGDATAFDIVHYRYRRDAEDKYYDPANRDGCPPSLLSGGGGGGSGTSSESDVAVFLIIDFTLKDKPDWKAQIDLLMKALSYLPGARVGVVQLDCTSDFIFGVEVASEDQVRKVISETKAKSTSKKATYQAYNIAAQWLMNEPRQNKKVIVLTDGEWDKCIQAKPEVDEFQITRQWRNADVQAVVLHVANGKKSPDDMAKIASDADSVISVPDFKNIDKSVYKHMAKLLCSDDSIPAPNPPPPPPSTKETAAPSPPSTKETAAPSPPSTQETGASVVPTTGTTPTGGNTTTGSTSRTVTAVSSGSRRTTKGPNPNGFDTLGDGEDLSIVVIMDFTQSAEKYWKEEIDYLIQGANSKKKARIGVVSLSCPSEILLPMGVHDEKQIRNQGVKILYGSLTPIGTPDTSVTKPATSGNTTPSSGNTPYDNMKNLTGNPEYVIDPNDVNKVRDALLKALQDLNGRNSVVPGVVTVAPLRVNLFEHMSIVVIIDFTQSTEKQWNGEIKFLIVLAKGLSKARFGVISLSCPSKILLTMGLYDENQLRNGVPLPTGTVP
ncbi:hypothetical protein GCK32_003109, partial [Trichostrongylus colubriformis]